MVVMLVRRWACADVPRMGRWLLMCCWCHGDLASCRCRDDDAGIVGWGIVTLLVFVAYVAVSALCIGVVLA